MKPVAVFLFILAIGIWLLSIWTVNEANAVRYVAAIEGRKYGFVEAAQLESSASIMRIGAGFVMIVSLVMLGVVFDRDRRIRNSKKCPQCAELVKKEAVKCRHCGSELIPQF